MLLGCIADDFTGATDLANNLVRGGMRAVQTIGVPARAAGRPRPTRSWSRSSRAPSAPHEAVAQSLAALRWLQAQGARQIYFKYCSTFDSTPHGNIGPVTEALMDALDTDFTIATPGLPGQQAHGLQGPPVRRRRAAERVRHANHPLTPMTDANLVRVLQAQTRRKVGLIDHAVARGAAAIRERIAQLRAEGVGIADRRCHLERRPAAPGPGAGRTCRWSPPAPASPSACRQLRHRAFGCRGALPRRRRRCRRWCRAAARSPPTGRCRHFIGQRPAGAGDRSAAHRGRRRRGGRRRWPGPRRCWPQGPVLVYSTAEPAAVQGGAGPARRRGRRRAWSSAPSPRSRAAWSSAACASWWSPAARPRAPACRRCGIAQLQIGAQIDPGVPVVPCAGRPPAARACTSR